jgi:hypothetical protein
MGRFVPERALRPILRRAIVIGQLGIEVRAATRQLSRDQDDAGACLKWSVSELCRNQAAGYEWVEWSEKLLDFYFIQINNTRWPRCHPRRLQSTCTLGLAEP